MHRGNTPSDYIAFLKSDKGKQAFENLKEAKRKVRPHEMNALYSVLGGLALAIIIYMITKSFYGLVFLLPSIYFIYIMGQKGFMVTDAQREFNQVLNNFIFGDDYKQQPCNVDFIPMGFMRGLPKFSGLWKESRIDLGEYGQAHKIRITRTTVREKDGKEEKTDKTTYEQGNLIVLPNNSIVKNKQAFFYFDMDKFDLLESMGVSFNDKRQFSFTDTELDKWYEVSVGGLKDVFKENQDEKFDWTKIITPYFEQVLKALVVKYGELHLVIQDGYFFAFVSKKEVPYKTVEYGKLDRGHYIDNNWLSNSDAEVKNGKSSPKVVLPYLYKIYLNKIMHAMTRYFFMDHKDLSPEELEEAREILDYTINEYNHIDANSMTQEYKNLE